MVVHMINIKKINENLMTKNSKILNTYIKLITYIYNNLNFDNPIYKDWENFFIYCYGDLKNKTKSANEKKYLKTLSKLYKINITNNSVYNFMYVLQSTYMLLLKLILLNSISKKKITITKSNINDIVSGKYLINNFKVRYWDYDFDYYLSSYYNSESLHIINQLLEEIYNTAYDQNIDKEIFFSDEFTKLYEYLFPKEIRHSLGEYYTPSWLTKDIINNYNCQNNSFIDPTCGSGVFLETIIKVNPQAQIYGFDLNPIAVLTTKLVLFFNNPHTNSQIYENDILMYPDLITKTNSKNDNYYLYIYGKEFPFPSKYLKDKNQLVNFFKNQFYNDEILNKIYHNKINQRIEAFYISNIDVAVGNPPWINWEYLPQKSKDLTKKIWVDYNLFSQNGKDLAFSKEDISLLITYIVIDKIIKFKGKLAFVLRTGSFKSKQNGVGFRNFKIGLNGDNIKVIKVEDYSKVKVFTGAINSTCVAYFEKSNQTTYPVPYFNCNKNNNTIIKEKKLAKPTTNEINSLWLDTTENELKITEHILGTNNYKARTGVFTGGANAVYWIKILDKLPNGHIFIENYTAKAKRQAEKIRREIEPDLVYKLCRGFELGKDTNDNIYLICPHTSKTKMKAIDRDIMIKKYPKTYDYLLYFKNILDERKGFTSWEKNNQIDNFYAIQRIGDYTFKKYKVAWKYISKSFDAFIISEETDKFLGKKLIMPSEKIIYVAFDNLYEAAYLAGILNSSVVKKTIESFMTTTSISTHILDKIKIDDFNQENLLHMQIANAFLQKDIDQLNRLIINYYHITESLN